MSGSQQRPEDPYNFFSGRAEYVIQFRDLHGDLNVYAPPVETPLERAARHLAEAVYLQWREEVRVWKIGDHAPLAVPWEADWTVADHPEKMAGHLDGAARHLDGMVSAFRRGGKRLVVLGAPGAGKTTLAVLLALKLLKDTEGRSPQHREPVPVPLFLTSWNPDREHLDAWIARRIREDYPALPSVEKRHPAGKLWAARRIMPVLDGLDEMPEDVRPVAVRQINQALTGDPLTGDPFLLTCRAEEFARLAEDGAIVGSTPVVTARPIEPRAAIDYLRLVAAPRPAGSWDRVFEQLDGSPGSPVARALSTPLMLWLARTVYASARAEPGELTDPRRFSTPEEIENHLLDGLIPAVFNTDPPSPNRLDAPRRWDPERARKSLGFLAHQLDRRHTTELAWWRLHRSPLARLMTLPLLAVIGIVVGQALAWGERWYSHEPPDAVLFASRYPLLSPGTSFALTFGVYSAGLVQIIAQTWFGRLSTTPRRRANPLRLAAAVRSAWRATSRGRIAGATALLLSSILPLALFVPGAARWLPLFLLGFALPAGLTVIFTAPSTAEETITPGALFRSEQIAVLLKVSIVGPMIGVSCGMLESYLGHDRWAVEHGVVAWVGATVVMVVATSWSRWMLAKLSLAGTARLPWSLMGFLRDAHHHGILRSVGAIYQFRNIHLQRRLAATVKEGSRSADLSVAAALTEVGQQAAAQGYSATSPRATVRETPGELRIDDKVRRVRMGSLAVAILLTPVHLLINTMRGRWDDPVVWIPLAVLWGIGIAVLVIGLALPPKRTRLRIDAQLIEYAEGRRRATFLWRDVSQIAMRRAQQFGVAMPGYGLQVRLRPGAPPPPRFVRGHDGWFPVSPMYNVSPDLPAEIERALARFAGDRWRPSAR